MQKAKVPQSTPLLCPFCYSQPTLTHWGDDKWTIGCEECPTKAMTPHLLNPKTAIEAWNTRKDNWFSAKEKLPDDKTHVQIYFPNVLTMAMYYKEYGFIAMSGNDFPVDVEYWRLPISPFGEQIKTAPEEEAV